MLTPADTRTRLHAAVIALLTFGLLAAPASAARGVYQCDSSLNIPQTDWQAATAANSITCLVNVERTSRGIPALTPDADLAQAANGHSTNMSRRQFFAHVNPAGDGLSARLQAAGYGNPGDGWYAAEDLGWGTGSRATPNAMVDAWLNSPHHRRILLSATYEEIGVGVAQGAPKPTASGLPGATYTMDLGTIRPG
ncbi:MAG TPA: CAP domain-containing protein [Solirubrobacter sp.]